MTATSGRRRAVVVVGGGIAGLVAALELAEPASGPAPAVTLVEASGRFGGKIATSRVDGLVIEAGADSFLSGKPGALALCRRLGLEDRLINTRPDDRRTFVYSKGRLRPLPEGLILGPPARAGSLLRSGLLSPAGAARMAADVVVARRRDGAEESIAGFFTRRLGTEAYARVVEPLLAGIHAGDAAALSLRATFPRFAEMERTHGGLVRAALADRLATSKRCPPRLRRALGPPDGDAPPPAPEPPPGSWPAGRTPFVSLRSGTSELIEALVARLERAGVTLLAGTRVSALHAGARAGEAAGGPAGDGAPRARFRLELEPAAGGSTRLLDADGVIVATPAPVAAALLAGLSPPAAGLLQAIPHASTATVSLAYRADDLSAPPAGYGFVVPRGEGRDLLAATWSSSKWEGRAPAGARLLRGYVGGVGREEVLAGDDDRLVDVVRAELAALAGISGHPFHAEVHRFPAGMPQYNLGHLDRVRGIRRALSDWPGLAVAGGAYAGVGIPDCITDATQAAAAVRPALDPE